MKFWKFDSIKKNDSFDRIKTVAMRYLHGKTKVNKGGKIAVTISKPTKVLILSEKDFRRYKNNQTFTYYGGMKEDSYEFDVPKSGLWHVVIEKGSYHKPEHIKANFNVVKGVVHSHSNPKPLAATLAEADEQLDHQDQEEETTDQE